MVCSVYALFSTRDGEIRYIGQTTKDLKHRMSRHRDRAGRGSPIHLYCWMRKEVADGFSVEHFVLSDMAEWHETEKEMIHQYRSVGARLLNVTSGGEGVIGYRHSEETRAKMSLTHVGKPYELTERRKAALAMASKRLNSPSAREKQAQTLRGRKLTQESIDKRTQSRRAADGYVPSEETRAKMSAAVKSWWKARKESANVAA